MTIHTQSFWFGVFPTMMLAALGMALVVSPLSAAVMTSVSDDDTGTASGINNAVSRVAGLVAVAAMGLVAASLYPVFAGQSMASASFGAIIEAQDPVIQEAHSRATTMVFSIMAGITAVLSALSAIIAWTTQKRKTAGASQ